MAQTVHGAHSAVRWRPDLQAAKEEAARENKFVFVDFFNPD
jgi:outer membrane murein-binding lipoprotein Lpp